MSRRALLRASSASALIGAVSGCTSSAAPPPSRPTASTGTSTASTVTATTSTGTPPGVSADVSLLSHALTDEDQLLAFCVAAIIRHPSLATELVPVRAAQLRHVQVMRAALPAVHVSRSGVHQHVPRRASAATAAVVSLLSQAERHRRDDCLRAGEGLLARLFAATAASHAMALQSLGGRR